MESRLGNLMAILLAIALIGFGAVEVYDHRDDSVGWMLLWGASLFGSAAVVVAGVVVRRSSAHVGTALLVIGCVVAVIPTLKTLVLPLLELGVIALALRDHARAA